jgi:hypothetical protein
MTWNLLSRVCCAKREEEEKKSQLSRFFALWFMKCQENNCPTEQYGLPIIADTFGCEKSHFASVLFMRFDSSPKIRFLCLSLSPTRWVKFHATTGNGAMLCGLLLSRLMVTLLKPPQRSL